MNMLRRSILFLALMAAPLTLHAQPLFIERPNGGACRTLGGTWTAAPVATCTIPGFYLGKNLTLKIRRGAKLVVPNHFANEGFIHVRDPTDSEQGSAWRILGN